MYPDSVISGIDETEFERSGGYFVIARQGNRTIGCGGLRPVDKECVEIKRMFVRPDVRRRGGARQILRHLEEEDIAADFAPLCWKQDVTTPVRSPCMNPRAIYKFRSFPDVLEFRSAAVI